MSGTFRSLEQMVLATAEAVRPPERLTVGEAAEKYRWVNNPGAYVGPYSLATTPYLREPMEVLTSLDFTGMIFVGPAQSGKSDMSLNWLVHSAACDPGDFMHIDKNQNAARDWFNRRMERLIRDTEALRTRLMPGQKGSSTYTTRFTSGMLATLSWPTVNELSGKPIGRIWLADYDRMPEDVGGEGSPYDLAVNRTKTFRRYAMTAAESSPSRDIEDPRWMRSSPHEAPPTSGILALYNRGDRRRWMWRCVSCEHAFEPDFDLMRWEDHADIVVSAESAHMVCPECGQVYREAPQEDIGIPGRRSMNQHRGFWLIDGQSWNPEKQCIEGVPRRSRIASFWLKGPAAFAQEWSGMVFKYLSAMREFDATGAEEALRTTINTDHAKPYLPIGMDAARTPEDLKARAYDLGEQGTVPEGVRFLVATVDVQPSRFEVMVVGFGEHDMWIVDRYRVRKSERRDDDGDRKPFNTASYVEDWELLVPEVITRTWPLADGSGRMQVKFTAIDSGGKEGTTRTAATFWRMLRDDPRYAGLHSRCHLLKGEAKEDKPLVRIDFPDAEKKDRKSGLRGDVPLMFCSAIKGKDAINVFLGRGDPGGGYIHFPSWLGDWFYKELTAETRHPKKGWINASRNPNESWDLLYYAYCVAASSKVGWERIDWSRPPGWAAPWAQNDLVSRDVAARFGAPESPEDQQKRLADLAAKLA